MEPNGHQSNFNLKRNGFITRSFEVVQTKKGQKVFYDSILHTSWMTDWHYLDEWQVRLLNFYQIFFKKNFIKDDNYFDKYIMLQTYEDALRGGLKAVKGIKIGPHIIFFSKNLL